MNQLAKTTRSTPLAQKIDEEGVRRLQLVIGETQLSKINGWRIHQPGIPNVSQAIRMLIDMALKAEGANGDKAKPKRSGK